MQVNCEVEFSYVKFDLRFCCIENGVAEKYRSVFDKNRRKVFFNNFKKEVSLHNIYKFKP